MKKIILISTILLSACGSNLYVKYTVETTNCRTEKKDTIMIYGYPGYVPEIYGTNLYIGNTLVSRDICSYSILNKVNEQND